MPALIPELIAMASDPAVATSDLLRKAKVAASRLQQTEAAAWLQHELDGYDTFDELPAYRRPRGVLYAIHPSGDTTPLLVEDGEVAERLSITPLNNPLRELEALMAAGASVRFRRPPDEVLQIQQILSTNLEPVIALTHGQLAGCLDAIRNRVLGWALALEAAGIQGKGMTFTAQELQQAQQVASVNISIGDNATGVQVQLNSPSGQQQQTVTGEQKAEALAALLPWLQQVIDEGTLSPQVQAELQANHTALQALANAPKPSWPVIGTLASNVRAILEGAGGGVLAAQALGWLATLGGS
ncbi:hypothetical protein KAM448_42030 [Aeromonas caviae]|uniref:AbiTii domain-containing protein n=1 Tax=Aeromonas caviae TaxID=648 RepID=A0ABD0BCJ1_AERCA|nr:hypothetical protein [Aeromonas caviae]GJA83673.1 hypothetical protein KAM355_42330 [Aeromonas caviae]GJB13342.1 hypothetical protein KAM362_39020 [Aeromonas caviae]GJB26503.1 hypothetical protein KAM365_42530 [Aeromonas caviae]GJB35129.1 hypothetical protein KAM367_42310 [Aeromonas caviae]GJB43838.1 hypothetical protein KAM369_43130 [Aeromonas caviae]